MTHQTRRFLATIKDPLVSISVSLIRLYRWIWSSWAPQCCRFEPSCSEYALESLRAHSWPRALILIVCRLLRCNPLFKGGIDLVPKKESRS